MRGRVYLTLIIRSAVAVAAATIIHHHSPTAFAAAAHPPLKHLSLPRYTHREPLSKFLPPLRAHRLPNTATLHKPPRPPAPTPAPDRACTLTANSPPPRLPRPSKTLPLLEPYRAPRVLQTDVHGRRSWRSRMIAAFYHERNTNRPASRRAVRAPISALTFRVR